MTDRYAQGTGIPHAGWSMDARIESVDQSRLWHNTSRIDASQIVDSVEEIEKKTRNLNFVTTLSYGIGTDWSVSLRIPVLRREHLHFVDEDGTGYFSTPEQWRLDGIGDVQALARRQFLAESGGFSYALFGGLKLPTGSIRAANVEGVSAERALQLGTGTTDVVAGVAGRKAAGLKDALIAQASITAAANSREGYQAGLRLEASVGWSHAYSRTLGTVLQVNVRHRAQDSGAQAEPGNSASTVVDISPGFTVALGDSSTLYAYVQLPVYQQIEGIQLVPDNALAIGWTHDF
jgi:hypothetical protein